MTLHEIGLKAQTDKAGYHYYCDFYEQHLPKKIKRLLEIGVYNGNGLMMWRDFYPDAEIIGVDINKPIHVPGCKVYQMDQTDVEALRTLGMFDVIIDDGSHRTKDQQITFNHLYFHQLKEGGLYIIEDMHTSFIPHMVTSRFNTVDMFNMLPYKKELYSRVPNLKDSVTGIVWK